MKTLEICGFLLLATAAMSQANPPKTPGDSMAGVAAQSTLSVPNKAIEFKNADSPAGLSLSPVTMAPDHCTADGSLFLDMVDPKDMQKQTVVSVRGDKSQGYAPENIQGLNDVMVMDFFPSDSVVGFLVRASAEKPGERGSGKSPAGIDWNSYHNYVAEFNRDGSFRKSVELQTTYNVYHFAILPSGEFVASGYDKAGSIGRLILMDDSGKALREFDLPAFRASADGGAPYGSADALTNKSRLLGYVMLTAYGQNVLVWHARSTDPVLEIGAGGHVREVPLQIPPGMELVGLISATDRWVAFFRSRSAAENTPLNRADFAYYEVNPRDGSLATKLNEAGDGRPHSITCETDGNYLAYHRDKDGHLIVLRAD